MYKVLIIANEIRSAPHNRVVRLMQQIVDDHLANPNLSLTWIGKELLYMNPDYLGRLFSKETGVKFSRYVLTHRIELAKHLIKQDSELKICEISTIAGFREDTQYFSKSFRKYTGMTPSEYKYSCVHPDFRIRSQ